MPAGPAGAGPAARETRRARARLRLWVRPSSAPRAPLPHATRGWLRGPHLCVPTPGARYLGGSSSWVPWCGAPGSGVAPAAGPAPSLPPAGRPARLLLPRGPAPGERIPRAQVRPGDGIRCQGSGQTPPVGGEEEGEPALTSFPCAPQRQRQAQPFGAPAGLRPRVSPQEAQRAPRALGGAPGSGSHPNLAGSS